MNLRATLIFRFNSSSGKSTVRVFHLTLLTINPHIHRNDLVKWGKVIKDAGIATE
jgi:hypothetical protein